MLTNDEIVRVSTSMVGVHTACGTHIPLCSVRPARLLPEPTRHQNRRDRGDWDDCHQPIISRRTDSYARRRCSDRIDGAVCKGRDEGLRGSFRRF